MSNYVDMSAELPHVVIFSLIITNCNGFWHSMWFNVIF